MGLKLHGGPLNHICLRCPGIRTPPSHSWHSTRVASLAYFVSFYNAELIDACTSPSSSAIGFVDNVNILVWGRFTAENCDLLATIYDQRCPTWADRHGAKFAPDKYEVIHFTRATKRMNKKEPLRLGAVTKHPSNKVRALDPFLDSRLAWHKHQEESV